MKTKVVYCLTSGYNDPYLEQTLVSVYSLKYYNPSAYVILIVDRQTDESFKDDKRGNILQYFNDKIVIDCPDGYNQMFRSRYIKTNIRNLVNGDYLYIDSDTVIASSISDIDNCEYEFAAVGDKHVLIRDHSKIKLIKLLAKKVGWVVDENRFYFNSGVIYVKDNARTRQLYNIWHEKWIKNANCIGQDQPTLAKADEMMGGVITPLDGIWNCQISDNGLKYLYDAKIIHYFSSTINDMGNQSPFLFHRKELYDQVRINEEVPDKVKDMVQHVKSQFSSEIILLQKSYTDMVDTTSFYYLYLFRENAPFLFELVDKTLNMINKISKKLKHIAQKD